MTEVKVSDKKESIPGVSKENQPMAVIGCAVHSDEHVECPPCLH